MAVGLRARLRKLERSIEGETVLALCLECGEEKRIRQGILLDLAVLDWQMHQNDTDELPADTPHDIRWVWEHPHDGLSLVDKYTREPVFGHKWAEAAQAMKAREDET